MFRNVLPGGPLASTVAVGIGAEHSDRRAICYAAGTDELVAWRLGAEITVRIDCLDDNRDAWTDGIFRCELVVP